MKQACKAYKDGRDPEKMFASEQVRDKCPYPLCIALNPRYPNFNTHARVKAVTELEQSRRSTVGTRNAKETGVKSVASTELQILLLVDSLKLTIK